MSTRLRSLAILAIAISAAVSGHSAETKKQPSVADEAARLCEEGQFLRALELLEPVRAKRPSEWGFQGGVGNIEEFMARLYHRAEAVDRGVKYFYRLFKEPGPELGGLDPEQARRAKLGRAYLDEALLELALEQGDFKVAMEAYQSKKARESWPGLDLDLARIQAAQGKRVEALETLRRYLRYEFADSRSRLIARREFSALHADASFQGLMTETTESFDAWLRERSQKHERLLPKPTCNVEGVKRALATYRKVTSEATVDALRRELDAADKELACDVGPIQDDLFLLLEQEQPNTLGRLILGTRLAGMKGTDLATRAVAEVSRDDFTAFPSHLFSLAYTVARFDPERARPFLMLMLRASSGGAIELSQHAMTVDEYGLLIQAFGVVETRYADQLVKVATGDSPTESRRAAIVLSGLQDSRVVPVLTRRAVEETKQADRRLFIGMLASMCTPEASTAMAFVGEKLKRQKDPDAEKVSELVSKMKPPKESNCNFMEADGIAINEPQMKQIFLDGLEVTHGADVSFVWKTLRLTSTKEDIPRLRKIRESVLHRFSDEAMGDHRRLSMIICELERESAGGPLVKPRGDSVQEGRASRPLLTASEREQRSRRATVVH